MSKNEIKAKALKGYSIYQYEGRTVLLEWFDGTPRTIGNEDARSYTLWQMRLPLAILPAALLFTSKDDILISVLLGVVIYVVLTIIYEFVFVRKLPVAKKFTKEKREPMYVKMANSLSRKRIILGIIMSIALAVLMVIYAYMEKYQGLYLICVYVLSVGVLVFTGICGYALFLQNNNQKK